MAKTTLPKPPIDIRHDYRNINSPSLIREMLLWINKLLSEIERFFNLSLQKGERIEVNGSDSTEITLISPDGTKYKIEVDNAGNISTSVTV